MILSGIWLELTRKCNLQCTHCGNSSGPHLPLIDNMELDDWVRVLRESRSLGATSIQFIGGEPTLHPDFINLLKIADQAGFIQKEVFTNATRITPVLIRAFKETGTTVAASIYGPDANTHNRMTQNTHSYRQTMKGLQDILDAGVELRMGVVINDDNRHLELEMLSMLQGMGIKHINVDEERKIGRLGTNSVEDEMKQLCGRCGSDRVSISSNGDVFPCIFSRLSKIGNILDTSVKDVISSTHRNDFIEKLIDSKGELQALCPPYSCNPEHSCAPSTSTPHCGPDFCFPGRKKHENQIDIIPL